MFKKETKKQVKVDEEQSLKKRRFLSGLVMGVIIGFLLGAILFLRNKF